MNLTTASLSRLKNVNPVLIKILIEAAKESPFEFQIPPFGGCRTAEEQHGLFLKGVSKCDGYKSISEHQKGSAYDIFLMIDGKASWDKDKLKAVQYHIKKIAKEKFNTELNLGCDWVSFVDYPHGQLAHI